MQVFCSAFMASSSLRFSCSVSIYFIAVFSLVGCDAIPLCFIVCFVCFIVCFASLIVLLVRYFTTLTPIGRVLFFGIAFFAYFVLFFSFGTVCLFTPFVAVYLFCLFL